MNYQSTRVIRALSSAAKVERDKKFQKKSISKQLQDIKRSDSKSELHDNVKKLENSISNVIDKQKTFMNSERNSSNFSSDARYSDAGHNAGNAGSNERFDNSGFFNKAQIEIINSANSSSEIDQVASVHLSSRLEEVERLLSAFETIEHHNVDHSHVLDKFHKMKKKLHELELHHQKEFTKSRVNDNKLMKENERLKTIVDIENEIISKEELIEMLYHDHTVDPGKIQVLKLKIKDLKDALEMLKS